MRLVRRLFSTKKWQRHLEVGLKALDAGRPEEARPALETASNLARKMFSRRDRRLSDTLLATARSCHLLGDSAGLSLDRQAYDCRRRYWGSESEPTVEALVALLGNNVYQDPSRDQEPLYRQALSHCQSLGRRDYRCATILGGLAFLQALQGRRPDAESLTRDALSICDGVYGRELDPRHVPDVATYLGTLCHRAGFPEQAVDFHRHSLRHAEKLHGGDSLEAAEALHRLGRACLLKEDVDQAIRYLRRSRQIQETPEVVATLGGCLHAAGELAKAERCYRRYLTHVESVLGPDSPRMAECLHHLMTVLYCQGQQEQARSVFERIQRLEGKAPRELRLDVARRLRRFGYCLGDEPEAETLLREALRIRQATLRSKDPLVGQSMADLARVLEPKSRERNKLEKKSNRLLRKLTSEQQALLSAEDRGLEIQRRHWSLMLRRLGRADETRGLGSTAQSIG